MPKSNERPELVVAAEAIDADVRRLEELSASNGRIKLTTEKNISRAAEELDKALRQQQRLAEGLRSLGEAVVRMQGRQQAALDALSARATQIQDRMTRLSEHMQRFGELGSRAAEVATMLQELRPPDADAAGGAADSAATETRVLMEVDERFTTLVDDARTLAEAARHEDFVEVAEEAHALKQKIHAMRERLAQIVKARAAGTS